jgi:hypothetical protein
MSNYAVPDRFRRVLGLHLIKNLIGEAAGWRVPLILGIHGPSGEGKTFQCEQVLRELNVRSFLISGGQLESPDAGAPAQLVRSKYIDASREIERGNMSVVLINDVDTGIGNWGDMVQYTMNRQTVLGELMHMVDYPTEIEGRKTRRVPVILTGNDFTKLYGPLVRAGRMTAFEWKPLDEERAAILSVMLGLDVAKCITLILELRTYARSTGQPQTPISIAFFSHVQSTLMDDTLWRLVSKVGPDEIIRRVQAGELPQIAPNLSFESLLKAGKEAIRSGHFLNHLSAA